MHISLAKPSRLARLLLAVCAALTFVFLVTRSIKPPTVGAEFPDATSSGASAPPASGLRSVVESAASRKNEAVTAVAQSNAKVVALGCILALDANGVPIQGARIYRREADQLDAMGTTNAEGRSFPPAMQLDSVAIVGVHSGYAATRVFSPRTPKATEELVLVFREANTIRGRVIDSDGNAVREGVLVLGFQVTRRQTLILLTAAEIVADPEVCLATTDTNGEFVLEGVNPAHRYELVAGGPGLVQGARLFGIAPGDEGITLVVHKAFGALVRLAGPDGTSPLLEAFGLGVSSSVGTITPGDDLIQASDLACALAGLPLGTRHRTSDTLIIATGADSGSNFVSVDFSTSPPGYGPVATVLELPPIEQGLVEIILPLSQISSGRGTIVFELDAPSAEVSAPSRSGTIALVTLAPESGPRWKMALDNNSSEWNTLRDIPFGTYKLQVEFLPTLFYSPELGQAWTTVEVGPEPARVRVDLTGTGALDINVMDAAGEPYTDDLILFVGRGRPNQASGPNGLPFNGGQVAYRQPPYRLPHLQAGEYSVRVDAPVGSSWVTFIVDPEERTTIVLELP